MSYLLRRGLSYLLALLMVANPAVLLQLVAKAQQPAKPIKKETPPEPSPEDLKRLADEMERAFKALEAAEKDIPRDTFDPKAIVDKVGRDPVKLFEWVRDNTYWVPYQGSLRGPIGVLMDRLGNSLDRALLLAELLRTKGQKVRLAHAELSEDQAKQLLPKIRAVPRNPVRQTPRPAKKEFEERITKYANQNQLDGAELSKMMEKDLLQSARLAEDITQRVAEQTAVLAKAVGKPSEKDAAAQRVREAADQLASLRDHWWVQRQDGTAWVDLDPLLPDAQANRAMAPVQKIMAPNRKDGGFHLDSKYCHEVVLRVVIEQWRKEGLKESTVLQHTLRPSELFGTRIGLNHYPMKWPKDVDLSQEKKPLERLKSTVLAQDEWLPILTVGSDHFIQSSFIDTGATIAMPLAPLLGGGAQKLGENIGGILGSGKIGSAPGRGPKKDTQLTAEWVEFEIQVPGRKPQKIRRQVFDLLGAARRSGEKRNPAPIRAEDQLLARGLALVGQREILPTVCQFSPDFAQDLLARKMLANRQILLKVFGQQDLVPRAGLKDHLGQITPLPSQLYTLALVRQQWSRFASDCYFDRPNILTCYSTIRQSSQGQLVIAQGFDIVANEMAVNKVSASDPFLVRLEQGVLDTNAEALLMATCGMVDNTAEMFAANSAKDMEWVTVQNIEDLERKGLEVEKEIRFLLEQDLKAGYVVIVPKRPALLEGRLATVWWRVDPISGHTLGLGEFGGQTATEKLIETIESIAVVAILCEAFIAGLDYGSHGKGVKGILDRGKAPRYGPEIFCALSAAAIGGGLATGSGLFLGVAGIICAILTNKLLGQ